MVHVAIAHVSSSFLSPFLPTLLLTMASAPLPFPALQLPARQSPPMGRGQGNVLPALRTGGGGVPGAHGAAAGDGSSGGLPPPGLTPSAAVKVQDAVVDWGHVKADVVQYGDKDRQYEFLGSNEEAEVQEGHRGGRGGGPPPTACEAGKVGRRHSHTTRAS
jgi:hypothetical protein